jgi:hypothetical protein
MNITHADRASQQGKDNRILLWSAVAILVVALLVALAVVFVGPRPLAANESFVARGIEADAARWTALGQHYIAQGAEAASRAGTLPYTDVSHFYAERMRVQAQENAKLALNPELIYARRAYRSQDSLALNPELAAARRGYRSGAVISAGSELEAAARPAVRGRVTCSFADNDLVVSEGLLLYRFERYC